MTHSFFKMTTAKYTGLDTCDWLDKHSHPLWYLDWPDFNPIENLCHLLQQWVKYRNQNPRNLEDLRDLISSERLKLDATCLQNLVGSLNHVQVIIKIKVCCTVLTLFLKEWLIFFQWAYAHIQTGALQKETLSLSALWRFRRNIRFVIPYKTGTSSNLHIIMFWGVETNTFPSYNQKK